MDTYIVRIYRRDAQDPERMVGRVENAESGEQRTFRDAGELLRCIGGTEGPAVSAGRSGRRAAKSG